VLLAPSAACCGRSVRSVLGALPGVLWAISPEWCGRPRRSGVVASPEWCGLPSRSPRVPFPEPFGCRAQRQPLPPETDRCPLLNGAVRARRTHGVGDSVSYSFAAGYTAPSASIEGIAAAKKSLTTWPPPGYIGTRELQKIWSDPSVSGVVILHVR